MSYARFGTDSDVYVYSGTDAKPLVCHACQLSPTRECLLFSYVEMLEHLEEHLAKGHKVPQYCIETITAESSMKRTIFGARIPAKDLAPPERN